MAEFLTMDEAKSKFGTKGRTNAGLTLGIIGTALAAFAGNNGGCGCGCGNGGRCQNIKWLSKPMKLALCHS